MLASGAKYQAVAEHFGVDVSSAWRFMERHQDEIEARRRRVDLAVEDLHIASKVNRIAEYDRMLREINEWLEEHTLSEETIRYDRDGNEAGRTIRFRRDVIEAKRSVLHSVAEELAQLPRAPDANINVNVATAVQLVWQDGSEA